MDGLDISPEALRARYEGRVRFIAGKYRGCDFEALVQAGHEGVLRARRRYFESPEPPPKTPFDKAVWSYIRNAVAHAACKDRPRIGRVDDVRHAASLEKMDDYFGNPSSRDLIGGALDFLNRVSGAELVELYVDPDSIASNEPTPEEHAEMRATRERIAAAVGFLERSEREVVEARYLDGLTFVSIAANMGEHEQWVRRTYHRALARIKDTLADQRSDQRRIR